MFYISFFIFLFLLSTLFFFLGASLGSFFGVVVTRAKRHESIVWPASHCDTCNKPLKWYDNIPVISYLSLKGKCRYCQAKIPLKFLVYEVVGGIFALVIGLIVISLLMKDLSW